MCPAQEKLDLGRKKGRAICFWKHFEQHIRCENVTFSCPGYVRELDDIKESSNQQEYDVVDLKKNYKIYIHKIQRAPSFAHMLHIDLEAGCLTRFRTSSPVPKENELLYKFLNCGTMKPLYYENEDFDNK